MTSADLSRPEGVATDDAAGLCPGERVDAPTLSPGDRRMRRLLRLPPEIDRSASVAGQAAMRTSLLISAVRCLLMYLVLPFVAPALIRAGGVVGVAAFVVDLVAVVCIVASIRRFFRAHDRRRWQYTAFAGVVLVYLAAFLTIDLGRVFW